MTWEGFYLICFVAGFALTAVALFGGSIHLPLHGASHVHLPHGPGGHGAAPAHSGASPATASVPPFNFATVTAFLAWFGGMGYLLAGHSGLSHAAVLAIAALTGAGGGALVFTFATRVLSLRERALDPADYDMVGVLASVSVPIRAGGTGEIVYSQGGTRRSAGARSDGGAPIERGSEVVVTRYEKGIAYVRLWEELAEAGKEKA